MSFPFSASKLPLQLSINGKYVDSKSDKKLTLINPRDQKLITDQVPIAGSEDVEAAVAAAEEAFKTWKKVGNNKKRDIMLKFASLIEENIEVLASFTRLNLGAPYEAFGKFEVGLCAEAFKYYAGWVDKLGGESWPGEDGFMKIVKIEPLGVTAGILPWNGPIGTIGLKAAPSLAAGNCIILKPSEKTPLGALALAALATEAGFPPGVFQVLSGDGTTGALLASHMRIRKVSFTGSIPTGKKIQEAAAKSNLKRVTLELGGKSPAVVFDDCNLENAVTWTSNAITGNTGQVCFAASRVYVQEGIYDKFIAKYKEAMQAKKAVIGDPEAKETQIGPLIDQDQFDRVSGFIKRGQEGQGTLLVGGQRIGDKGYYIEPTVFTDVDPTSEIHTQEIFGPVSVVRKFKTEEEVLKWSNETDFGLMAGVFTQDISKAIRVASEFEAGMVGVNCVSMMFLGQPFGGYKQSGIGREGGKEGMLAWMDLKTIFINTLS